MVCTCKQNMTLGFVSHSLEQHGHRFLFTVASQPSAQRHAGHAAQFVDTEGPCDVDHGVVGPPFIHRLFWTGFLVLLSAA